MAPRPSDTPYPIQQYGSIRHAFSRISNIPNTNRTKYNLTQNGMCPLPAYKTTCNFCLDNQLNLIVVKDHIHCNAFSKGVTPCTQVWQDTQFRMSDMRHISARNDTGSIIKSMRGRNRRDAVLYRKRLGDDTRIVQRWDLLFNYENIVVMGPSDQPAGAPAGFHGGSSETPTLIK